MEQLTVYVDDGIMALAESACMDVGFTLSETVCLFIRRIAYDRNILHEICQDPFWSGENMARLRKSAAQLEAGEGKVHELEYNENSALCKASLHEIPNAITAKAQHDAEKGIDLHGPYDTVEDLMKSLEKDD